MNLWEKAVVLAASNYISQGDLVLDLGSNIGGVAQNFSELVGKEGNVICFEANPNLLEAWKEQTGKSPHKNLQLIQKAVWGTSGQVLELFCDESIYGSSSSVVWKDESRTTIKVGTVALDDLDLPKVSLIKLDIEGSESQALLGGLKLIKRDRPTIILECQLPQLPKDGNSLDILESLDYRFFSVNNYKEVKSDYAQEPGPFNVLAIPKEKDTFPKTRRSFFQIKLHPNKILLPKGRFTIEVDLHGPFECQGGIGIFDIAKEDYAIYYMSNYKALSHSTNSSLPVYLDSPTLLQVKSMQHCDHPHLKSFRVRKVLGFSQKNPEN
jgi:FkbM family methyltransferase